MEVTGSILSKMTGALIRRGKKRQAERRWPCFDGGRDWSETAVSQRMLRIAGHHKKLREKDPAHSSPEPLQEHTLQHFDFRYLASRIVRE